MVEHVMSLNITALLYKEPVSTIASMIVAVFRVMCSLHRGTTTDRSYISSYTKVFV